MHKMRYFLKSVATKAFSTAVTEKNKHGKSLSNPMRPYIHLFRLKKYSVNPIESSISPMAK